MWGGGGVPEQSLLAGNYIFTVAYQLSNANYKYPHKRKIITGIVLRKKGGKKRLSDKVIWRLKAVNKHRKWSMAHSTYHINYSLGRNNGKLNQ